MNWQSSGQKYWWLLTSLIGIYLIGPIFERPEGMNVVAEVTLILVLISSIWVISDNRKKVLIALLIAIFFVFANFLSRSTSFAMASGLVAQISGLVLFGYITGLVFKQVFFARRIDTGVIIGAICVYMLIGIGWAFVYGLIELLSPNSFSLVSESQNIVGRFIYFSLVTLTTVGYGDITPITSVARSFATAEAMLGQMYLTVLVAKLVSTHASQESV